jgi:hypothetical protein
MEIDLAVKLETLTGTLQKELPGCYLTNLGHTFNIRESVDSVTPEDMLQICLTFPSSVVVSKGLTIIV